jgi:hypothetical protein
LPDAIFERSGDTYTPTDAALSPWSDQLLHGGPPAMLMAREVERVPSDQPMFVSRLTIELLRPVGRAPLTVRSRLVRPGRKVQLVEASLWNGDLEVARTTALRMRVAEVEVPSRDEPPGRPPPERLVEWSGSWRTGAAYHTIGVEVRTERFAGIAAVGWAWFRLKLPVVPGEEATPLQRICAAADFPNGISFVVDPRLTTFVNPDLTVYLHRLPLGEWVLVDARSRLEAQGTGMAEGELFDQGGRLGRSLQSLLVEPRA